MIAHAAGALPGVLLAVLLVGRLANAGEPPALSVEVGPLPPTVELCEVRTVSVGLEHAGAPVDPRDVLLELSGLAWYAVDPRSTVCFGTVAPVSCMPAVVGSGSLYEWYFADGFSAPGTHASIQLDMQKRCTGGALLEATAYWDDEAHDDDTPERIHHSTGSATTMLVSGELDVEQAPETTGPDSAVWGITLRNEGVGTARNVWLDDLFGAGLSYVVAVVDDMTGVTVTPGMDHLGTVPYNGFSVVVQEMAPGDVRQITVVADVLDVAEDSELTSDVAASWGCLASNCQIPVEDAMSLPEPACGPAASIVVLALLGGTRRRRASHPRRPAGLRSAKRNIP